MPLNWYLLYTKSFSLSKLICKNVDKFNMFFYPNATSKIIIIIKPKAKPNVPKLECFPTWDSGINSSTTTYIIDPAAKDNK